MSTQALVILVIAAVIALGYMWYRRKQQETETVDNIANAPEEGNEQ